VPKRSANTGDIPSGDDGLTRLIALEATLADRLKAAQQEAQRILAEARSTIGLRELEGEGVLAAAAAALRERIGRDCRAEADRLLEAGRLGAQRLSSTADDQIERLARWVVQRVAEGSAEETGA
jgi:hypothetical protein